MLFVIGRKFRQAGRVTEKGNMFASYRLSVILHAIVVERVGTNVDFGRLNGNSCNIVSTSNWKAALLNKAVDRITTNSQCSM